MAHKITGAYLELKLKELYRSAEKWSLLWIPRTKASFLLKALFRRNYLTETEKQLFMLDVVQANFQVDCVLFLYTLTQHGIRRQVISIPLFQLSVFLTSLIQSGYLYKTKQFCLAFCFVPHRTDRTCLERNRSEKLSVQLLWMSLYFSFFSVLWKYIIDIKFEEQIRDINSLMLTQLYNNFCNKNTYSYIS